MRRFPQPLVRARFDARTASGAGRLRYVDFEPGCERELLGLECPGSIVPGKVRGLMAAAGPNQFIGPRTTRLQILARHDCGCQADHDDPQPAVELLLGWAGQPEPMKPAGRRCRQGLLQDNDRAVGTARIAATVEASMPASTLLAVKAS